jgi:TadE-like protein
VEFAMAAPILFLLVLGTFELGRYVFYYELLNNATREGSRYAIIHGSRADCPSGPPPPGETNPCDPTGANVKAAVTGAALDFASAGDLFVFDPVWTSRGSLSPPKPGDPSTGSNGRGDYVTVFVDFTYDSVLGQVLGTTIVPSLTIRAESTLVVNN